MFNGLLMFIKRKLRYECNHRWLIVAHVCPIVGHIKSPEYNHPLHKHRFAYYGYNDMCHKSKVMHPLAGCRAYCRKCGTQFNDIQKGEFVIETYVNL